MNKKKTFRYAKHGHGKFVKQFIKFMDDIDKASIADLEVAEYQFGDWDCESEFEHEIVHAIWRYLVNKITPFNEEA